MCKLKDALEKRLFEEAQKIVFQLKKVLWINIITNKTNDINNNNKELLTKITNKLETNKQNK